MYVIYGRALSCIAFACAFMQILNLKKDHGMVATLLVIKNVKFSHIKQTKSWILQKFTIFLVHFQIYALIRNCLCSHG